MSVELTILVDGPSGASAPSEQGLAILVRGPGRTMLFDCGASAQSLAASAAQFGPGISGLDGVILSHGHSSHTGGLAALTSSRPEGTEVYVHEGAFRRRWADKPGSSLKEMSCPHTVAMLTGAGFRLHWVREPERIEDWLILSGPIGGPPAGEEHYVVRKGEELVVDNFEDEIFVLLRGQRGWVVLTGCCHRGLRNTLRCARFLAHEEPISAIVGGLHLDEASRQCLDDAIEQVRQAPGMTIYPCHCTGQDVVEYLRAHLPQQVHPLGAGSKISL
jgi:7,8-dihydropterin-6-yl-methyl-4-(beta-D-ribofuranosyl)aminobenzene 5'-phosphate synthase